MFQPELLARGNCSALDFWKWKRIAIVLKGVLRKSCIKITRSMCNCVSPSMCMPMHVTERERAEKEKGKRMRSSKRAWINIWMLREEVTNSESWGFFVGFLVFFSFASWKNADVVVSGTEYEYQNLQWCFRLVLMDSWVLQYPLIVYDAQK